jgi:hypothetical protein
MLVVAVVRPMLLAQGARAAQVAEALQTIRQKTVRQILAAAAQVHMRLHPQIPVPAAPVSSSSNTTSALPQSSPSSPRRTGLHLRVR